MEFDPATQMLVFKQSIIDNSPIYVYSGNIVPSIVIIPSDATEEMIRQYWEQGMTYLFDVVEKIQ